MQKKARSRERTPILRVRPQSLKAKKDWEEIISGMKKIRETVRDTKSERFAGREKMTLIWTH